MKKTTLSCLVILLIAACSSPDSRSAKTNSLINNDTLAKAKTAVYSLCFLNKQEKDSTSIELVIHGIKVTGQMNWLPYQKDSRKGTLDGIIKNDTLHATWSFMQEGMEDTLMLNFRFKNGMLAQKPLKLNIKTGREQTDESAGYTIQYDPDIKFHK